MDVTLALWLFGGCGTLIFAAFGYAAAAHTAVAKTKEDLMKFKIHAAEYFASYSHTAAIETRTVSTLNEIKESLKTQNSKIDRLIERRVST